MKSVLEWHDSELLAISTESATETVILLDAYVHRKAKQADATVEGGNQRVRINLPNMRCENLVPEMPADIYGGLLVLGGVEHNSGLVPLPMHFEGEVTLSLTMRETGQELLFFGTGMTIEPDGEFRFVEVVPFDPFSVGEE